MSFALANRVKETSTTNGTGTLDLDGPATGFQSFVAGVGDNNSTVYMITDGTDWEVGLGTVSDAATDTLSRDVIFASSNSDAAVNWAGSTTKDVICGFGADGFLQNLVLYSTDAGASAGPELFIRRSSASPAANDELGKLTFHGRDSGGANNPYASLLGHIIDPTNGTEDGALEIKGMIGGADSTLLKLQGAQSYTLRSVQVFTGSGTWTKPAGTNAVLVRVVGGGGAGGGAAATGAGASDAGGGGGAGEYAEKFITSGLGATETVTIGAGGTGVSGGTGGNGGTTSFGSHVTAAGGSGSANIGAGAGLTAGGFGSGGTGGSGGDLHVKGSEGTGAWRVGNSVSGAVVLGFGGHGGASAFGAGTRGKIATTTSAGLSAQRGAGGGGAANGASQSAVAGGDGGDGVCIVYNFN